MQLFIPPEAEQPQWMQIALAESGVREVPGKGMNERIAEYYAVTKGAEVHDDAVPWCSAFACWCLEQAGLESTRSRAARSFLNYGTALAKPRFGCIIVLSRGAPDSKTGHVGFYGGMADKSQAWVFGGNQGNKVGWAMRDWGRLLGLRWP